MRTLWKAWSWMLVKQQLALVGAKGALREKYSHRTLVAESGAIKYCGLLNRGLLRVPRGVTYRRTNI